MRNFVSYLLPNLYANPVFSYSRVPWHATRIVSSQILIQKTKIPSKSGKAKIPVEYRWDTDMFAVKKVITTRKVQCCPDMEKSISGGTRGGMACGTTGGTAGGTVYVKKPKLEIWGKNLHITYSNAGRDGEQKDRTMESARARAVKSTTRQQTTKQIMWEAACAIEDGVALCVWCLSCLFQCEKSGCRTNESLANFSVKRTQHAFKCSIQARNGRKRKGYDVGMCSMLWVCVWHRNTDVLAFQDCAGASITLEY